MVDLGRPVGTEVIVWSIVFIVACVAVGLAVVEYYKKREGR
jgi:hypothetical protein